MITSFSAWLSFFADILSVAGFCVAVYSALKIRSLSSWYALRIEGERMFEQISSYVNDLTALRVDYENNYDRIRFVLAECQPTLAWLKKKLPLVKQLRLRKISRRLHKVNQSSERLAQDEFEAMYLELVSIRQVIHHLLTDAHWER